MVSNVGKGKSVTKISTKIERATNIVNSHLSTLGFKKPCKIAHHPEIPDTAHFFITYYHMNSVSLTIAVLAPNGKLYFPITNEVVDLNENVLSPPKKFDPLAPIGDQTNRGPDRAGQY